ncbi:MAG: hypothetical protein LZF86_110815 [Nitrospira sp.]|nr:MAG: hypothetical protein LZF86_110815 [Nitrospira sp.]
MQVCVIDGRGGGLGCRLVAGLRATLGPECQIVALGTNVAAADAMKQAGAGQVAAGPQAIARRVPTVDVIVASLNMMLPGAMLGEVTPEIVQAILAAKAKKVLLPLNRAQVEIVGTEDRTLEMLIDRSLVRVGSLARAACQA